MITMKEIEEVEKEIIIEEYSSSGDEPKSSQNL